VCARVREWGIVSVELWIIFYECLMFLKLQLKDEIQRCEELKRQNIKRFVEEIWEELKCWWDKCLVGEEERLHFQLHSSECFTEDLLELHDLEEQQLWSYYEQNKYVIIYWTKCLLNFVTV
jgi:hypothetical protein